MQVHVTYELCIIRTRDRIRSECITRMRASPEEDLVLRDLWITPSLKRLDVVIAHLQPPLMIKAVHPGL
jgi:hypothetical protein